MSVDVRAALFFYDPCTIWPSGSNISVTNEMESGASIWFEVFAAADPTDGQAVGVLLFHLPAEAIRRIHVLVRAAKKMNNS